MPKKRMNLDCGCIAIVREDTHTTLKWTIIDSLKCGLRYETDDFSNENIYTMRHDQQTPTGARWRKGMKLHYIGKQGARVKPTWFSTKIGQIQAPAGQPLMEQDGTIGEELRAIVQDSPIKYPGES